VLYNTVIAQAQKIEIDDGRVAFSFLPHHRTLREKLDQNRAWLEQLASEVAGRQVTIASTEEGGATAPQAPAAGAEPGDRKKPADLKAEAMADAAVQAMLDVFPAEISDVEEM
jgi:hypothetical protein